MDFKLQMESVNESSAPVRLNRITVFGRQPTLCQSISVIQPEFNRDSCRYTSEEELSSFLAQELIEFKKNCNGFNVVSLDCEWVDIHRFAKVLTLLKLNVKKLIYPSNFNL